jgi:hypothetical protein
MRESRSPVLMPSATELSASPGVILLDKQRFVIVTFKFVTKNRVQIAERMLQNAGYIIIIRTNYSIYLLTYGKAQIRLYNVNIILLDR